MDPQDKIWLYSCNCPWQNRRKLLAFFLAFILVLEKKPRCMLRKMVYLAKHKGGWSQKFLCCGLGLTIPFPMQLTLAANPKAKMLVNSFKSDRQTLTVCPMLASLGVRSGAEYFLAGAKRIYRGRKKTDLCPEISRPPCASIVFTSIGSHASMNQNNLVPFFLHKKKLFW